jgi:hypothetical protein
MMEIATRSAITAEASTLIEGEYRAEANRLERTALLDPLSSLSASGVSSVETLLNLAEVLELGDVRNSSFFSAITALQNEELELTDESNSLRDQLADMESRCQDTVSELVKVDDLHSSAMAEVARQCLEPTIPLEQLRAKQAQYADAEQCYQAHLNYDFVTDQGITHSQILELVRELQATQKATVEDEEKLKAFYDLPPNLVLARQKVQEQKDLLDQVSADFDREVTQLAASMSLER